MESLIMALILTIIIFALALKEKYNFMILSLLLLVICTCLYKYGKREEEFQNYAPLKYGIGEYSNLVLKPEGKSNWRHEPSDLPLLDNNVLYQGNQLPLNVSNKYYFDDNESAPNVDGEKGSPKSLFMFSNNECRPECCPSTYSCDKGCVCTTEQQRKFINNRGISDLNALYTNDNDI